MAVRSVSFTIRSMRKQLGLSQEDLADGIMDRRTLARIEKGEAMPSANALGLLLEKLGLNPSSTTAMYVTDDELRYHATMNLLDVALANCVETEASRLIDMLSEDKAFCFDRHYKQYLLVAKAALAMQRGEDGAKVISLLSDALSETRKHFLESKLAEQFLSDIDYKILNLKAVQYVKNNEPDKALIVLHGLKDNIERNCIDVIERGRRYPQVIYNLTKQMGSLVVTQKDYMPIVLLCDKGRKACLDSGFAEFLPYILYNKACALCGLGEVESAAVLLIQSYYVFAAFEKADEGRMVRDYAHSIGVSV